MSVFKLFFIATVKTSDDTNFTVSKYGIGGINRPNSKDHGNHCGYCPIHYAVERNHVISISFSPLIMNKLSKFSFDFFADLTSSLKFYLAPWVLDHCQHWHLSNLCDCWVIVQVGGWSSDWWLIMQDGGWLSDYWLIVRLLVDCARWWLIMWLLVDCVIAGWSCKMVVDWVIDGW